MTNHEPTGHIYECPGCGKDCAEPNEPHKPGCPRASPPEGQASGVRVPKVRTNHYRNKEKAARLQAIVDKKYAALGKETKT